MMNDREFSNRKETLHGEFYENALKYPERIALIYENEKVSYKMLRLYALRAANYMWQRGVRKNDRVVVILPRLQFFRKMEEPQTSVKIHMNFIVFRDILISLVGNK